MSLWDAWREWAAGRSTLDLELWGLDMLWWGRIGKLLQFAGALTVVLDIIGPQRLISFGESLRSASPFAGMVTRARQRWQPVWEWVRRRRTGPALAHFDGPTPRGMVQLVVRVVLLILGLLVGIVFASWGWLLVLAVLFSGVLLLAVAAIVSLVGQGIFTLVLHPFARLISVPSIDAWAKSLGLVLLLAGFHFDLLAT